MASPIDPYALTAADISYLGKESPEQAVSSLHDAIRQKKGEEACRLVRDGAPLYERNDDGDTPLHVAIRKRLRTVVEVLVEWGAPLNTQNHLGECPLHLIAHFGYSELARRMIEKGASVHERDLNGNTPLHEACKRLYTKMVALLLDNGADPNAQNVRGLTPLHLSIINNESNWISLTLLDRGALFNLMDQGRRTPLFLALKHGRARIAAFLARRGAHLYFPEEGPESLLHAAVRDGHDALIRTLLKLGVPIEAQNEKGDTPLHLAVKKELLDTCQALLRHGAPIGMKNKEGHRPIDLARSKESQELISLLENPPQPERKEEKPSKVQPRKLRHNPKKRQKVSAEILRVAEKKELLPVNTQKLSALQRAIYQGEEALGLKLLGSASSVSERTSEGLSLLHLAAQRGCICVAERLVEKDPALVDVTEPSLGSTPYHVAANYGQYKVLEVLGRRHDLRGRNLFGQTALHYAAFGGSMDCVVYLLRKGLPFDQDQSGLTPMHFAVQYEHEDLISHFMGLKQSEVTDSEGNLPIHRGLFFCKEKAVHRLLSRRVRALAVAANKVGVTPLHLAASRGFLAVVRKLVGFYGDVDVVDRFGRTPSSLAVLGGHQDVVEFLAEKSGANQAAKSSSGLPPVDVVVTNGNQPVTDFSVENQGVSSGIEEQSSEELEDSQGAGDPGLLPDFFSADYFSTSGEEQEWSWEQTSSEQAEELFFGNHSSD